MKKSYKIFYDILNVYLHNQPSVIVSTDYYVLPSLNLNVLVMVVVFYPFFIQIVFYVLHDIHPGGNYSNIINHKIRLAVV